VSRRAARRTLRSRRSLLRLALAPAVGLVPVLAGIAPTHASALGTIQHVVFIMQENRSFDSYFGTFPGADGIPMDSNGVPTVCVPDPRTGGCDVPYHDPNLNNRGGPHGVVSAIPDIDSGKMDGFVAQAETLPGRVDVMGYHDSRELPTYWSYASQFTLQDHMFAPSLAWSGPEHKYLVSGWSATCSTPNVASSCSTSLQGPPDPNKSSQPGFAWTDITYLLHQAGVSWGYYVSPGTQPDCDDGSVSCCPTGQNSGTLGIWNPLPDFTTVHQDNELSNIQDSSNFYTAAANGTLPSVSWVVPDQNKSDHPGASVAAGQQWVSSLVNAVMHGPDWQSTAIFVGWDEWGGFYDHEPPPPAVDASGYGIRVPGLLISPWAKRGAIDSQVLSFDAYLKFVEDVFLGGQRLDPATDGRPDPRPDVRENASILGDLSSEFDFTQAPLPVLTGLSPPLGSAAGGSTVRIEGADLTGATGVSFGGTDATDFSVVSDNEVDATAPPGTGGTDITVTTPAGSSIVSPVDHYAYVAGPVVDGVSPNSGTPASTVTIAGTGFTAATGVTFGGVPAESFSVDSDTSITATAPSGRSAVDVVVSGPDGTSPATAGDQFRYTTVAVSGLTPAGGRSAGCTTVAISGWGFTGATAVDFGATPALAVDVLDDTHIMAVSPPGTATVDVSVTTPAGTSTVNGSDVYTYTHPPELTGLSQPSGPRAGGTTLVISGGFFTGVTSVTIGGKAASYTVDSPAQITAITPSHAKGTVTVVVTTIGGTTPRRSAAAKFTYTA
jgi:phospholipase C